MPRHVLALALIQLAGVPVAAPSANASTKPSPTAAEHVAYDLDGRIEQIIDAGPCDVGVESTVVDGLSDPPIILRPGGISLEQIRTCSGWEETQIGYKNTVEHGTQPRAPGMKYRHYSPKATVVLYEAGKPPPSSEEMVELSEPGSKIGIICTRSWLLDESSSKVVLRRTTLHDQPATDCLHPGAASRDSHLPGFAGMLQTLHDASRRATTLNHSSIAHGNRTLQLSAIGLGSDSGDIARGIFSALRDLDRQDVNVIFVEGIDDSEGDTAAAVMNRLRKAAEVRVDI